MIGRPKPGLAQNATDASQRPADPAHSPGKRKRNEDGKFRMSRPDWPLCSEERSIRSKLREVLYLRKEVIQPQVPLRLPCYDFTPVADPTVVGCFLAVSAPASGRTNSHGVTGGVYKARERIHRGMLIHDY